MQNSISTLDSITISNDANIHLSGTKFTDVVTTSLENKANEIPYITTALHALGNHLYTEAGDNINKLNLEELYQLLKALQKEYYSNSDILTNINYIFSISYCITRIIYIHYSNYITFNLYTIYIIS